MGATPTTHILKPVAGDYQRIDIVEQMTMRAAALLGLPVARSTIESFNGIATFVVERYDREYSAGVWHRLHQEDLGQSLSVHPAKKYQRLDGGPGVAEASRLFRGLGRPPDRAAVTWDFYRGLMFNTVVQGTDAHIKNYSMMLNGNRVRLAPLYDLATYGPYRRGTEPIYSAMRIGGEYRFDAIWVKQCIEAATQLRLDADRAAQYLAELRAGVRGAFETARDELVQTDRAASDFATGVLDSVSELPLVD